MLCSAKATPSLMKIGELASLSGERGQISSKFSSPSEALDQWPVMDSVGTQATWARGTFRESPQTVLPSPTPDKTCHRGSLYFEKESPLRQSIGEG